MRTLIIIGLILIALGIVSLGYEGFTYTTRERVVDAGPLQVNADRSHWVSLPPLLGAGALVAGLGLAAIGTFGSRKD